MENLLYDLIKGELNWAKWYLSCNQSNQDQCPCSPTSKKKRPFLWSHPVSAQASCLHCARLSGWWFKLFTRQWPDATPTKNTDLTGSFAMQCFLLKCLRLSKGSEWSNSLIENRISCRPSKWRYLNIDILQWFHLRIEEKFEMKFCWADVGCPSLLDWIDTISNPREILTPHMHVSSHYTTTHEKDTNYVRRVKLNSFKRCPAWALVTFG